MRGKKKLRRAIKEAVKFYREEGMPIKRKDIVKYPKEYGVYDIDREIRKFEKEYEPKPKKKGRSRSTGGGGGFGIKPEVFGKDKTGRRKNRLKY